VGLPPTSVATGLLRSGEPYCQIWFRLVQELAVDGGAMVIHWVYYESRGTYRPLRVMQSGGSRSGPHASASPGWCATPSLPVLPTVQAPRFQAGSDAVDDLVIFSSAPTSQIGGWRTARNHATQRKEIYYCIYCRAGFDVYFSTSGRLVDRRALVPPTINTPCPRRRNGSRDRRSNELRAR
jgi:hypothetical protein